MRLHLVRHGETRHNVEGRIQGDLLDDDLDETGDAQADALARHYAVQRAAGLAVDAVYTSPLARARSTARRICKELELDEPTVLPGVREISWGSYMGELNRGPILVEMTRILTAWEHGDLGARAPGGETPGMAWERAMADLAPALARRKDGDTVVLVAHGRMNKILLSGLLHGHLHHMERYPQANGCISVAQGPHP